jgi:hypothetical protein
MKQYPYTWKPGSRNPKEPEMITDAWGRELEVGDIVVYPPDGIGLARWNRAVVCELGTRKRYGRTEPLIKVRRLCEAQRGRVVPAVDQQRVYTLEAPERVTKVGRRF